MIYEITRASWGPVGVEQGCTSKEFSCELNGVPVSGTYCSVKTPFGGPITSTVRVLVDGKRRRLKLVCNSAGFLTNGICGEATRG